MSTAKKEITVKSAKELRQWLLDHHNQTESVWLITYKKSKPGFYISRWDVLDELICFGWIDGARKKLDEHRTMQLISPRRVQHWAQTYKDRATKLIAADKMHLSGLECIKQSKENGLWDFMEDVDRLVIPKDLNKALELNHVAHQFFTQLSPSKKRFALRWLKLAKGEQTRKNRISKILYHSGREEKLPGS